MLVLIQDFQRQGAKPVYIYFEPEQREVMSLGHLRACLNLERHHLDSTNFHHFSKCGKLKKKMACGLMTNSKKTAHQRNLIT